MMGMIAEKTVPVSGREIKHITVMMTTTARKPLMNMEMLVPRESWITCTSELSLLTTEMKSSRLDTTFKGGGYSTY